MPLSGRVAPGVVQDSRSNISHQFSLTYRLLRADGFDHVIRAENIADKHFKIFFTPNYHKNARLGIIASKRTLPGAVERNRIKRVIRETFRQNTIKLRKLDLVVIVRCNPYQNQIIDTHIDYLERLFSQVEKNAQNSNYSNTRLSIPN